MFSSIRVCCCLALPAGRGNGAWWAWRLLLAGFRVRLAPRAGACAARARRFGIGTEDITLYLIGGVARPEPDAALARG